MKKLITSTSLVVLMVAAPHTGAGAPTALSESEFLSAFDRANPSLAAIDAEVDRAAAAVTAAKQRPEPSLILDREQVFGDGSASAETRVGLGWVLDLSGRRTRLVQRAHHGVTAATLRGNALRHEARVRALSVYRAASHARQRVALLAANRRPLQQALARLTSRVSAGDAAGYDLARLQLELGDYDDKLTSARADLAHARKALARLVGDVRGERDASSDVTLPALPAAPQPSARDALAARPEYRALSRDVDAARAHEAAAGRWWIPSLGLSVGFKSGDEAAGYFAAMSVDIPVFNRGRAGKHQARADLRVARARMRVLERDVPASIFAAHDALRRAVAQARAYDTTVAKHVDALVAKATSRYRGGEGSVVELLDAHRLARETRLRHLALQYAASRAQLALWHALGSIPVNQ